ncbi:MAG: hypothetical protein V8T10_00140 [Merdibacter sp.]
MIAAITPSSASTPPERKAEHLPHQFLCHGLPPCYQAACGSYYIIAQKGEMLATLSFPFRQSRKLLCSVKTQNYDIILINKNNEELSQMLSKTMERQELGRLRII